MFSDTRFTVAVFYHSLILTKYSAVMFCCCSSWYRNDHLCSVFIFPTALCGDTGLVSARLHIFTGAEGGRGSISCYLHHPNTTKYFCKEECEGDGILVKTEDIRAQNGRFSTEYRRESSGIGVLTVTITNLTMSDAGRYRCGFGTDLAPDSYADFELRVSDGEFLLKIHKPDLFSEINDVGIFILSIFKKNRMCNWYLMDKRLWEVF